MDGNGTWLFWALLSAVFAALTAVAFLHERPTVRDWLGILMIGGGVLMLAIKRWEARRGASCGKRLAAI